MDFGGSMLWKVAKGWWQVGGIEQWEFGAARSGIQIAASGSHVIAFSFLHTSGVSTYECLQYVNNYENGIFKICQGIKMSSSFKILSKVVHSLVSSVLFKI